MTLKTENAKAYNRILYDNGYFDGLNKIKFKYDPSKEVLAELKAMLFKHIMVKVREAKKEIAHLQASVNRLEAICQSGAIPQPAQGVTIYTPLVVHLQAEMKAFDGWTISLLESNVALLHTVHNPDTAAVRVNGLRASFSALWALRQENARPFNSFPEQFDMTVRTR